MDVSDAAWADRRARVILDPTVIQLNAGTCSPTPQPVFERVSELRRRQAASPTEFQWRDAWPMLQQSREALAGYLSGDPRNLALVENVTVAINIAAQSLELPPGAEILTSPYEYGSMLLLWKRLAAQRGWTVREAAFPKQIEQPRQILDAFAAAASDSTRLLFFSHVSSPTGLIFPAVELCRMARQHGWISVIDGAHAPGQIEVNLREIDADFYCANGHKWMMAPASVGFLHVSARQKRATRSIISSWGHGYLPHQADDEAFPGTSRWQYDLEFHGTADRTPQMVLPEVIGFRQSIGGDSAIRARVRHLTTRLRNHLRELNLRPFSPDDARLVGNLTAILLPEPFQQPGGFLASPADTPAARLQRRLWEHHRIECPVTHADGRTFLRISTGWFNTEQEIDRLALALRQELAA